MPVMRFLHFDWNSWNKDQHGSHSILNSICDSDSASDISGGGPPCRICHEPPTDDMVEPCKCKGEMAKVHLQCLEPIMEEWLNDKEIKFCEHCSHQYEFKILPKYRPYESIKIWCNRHLSATQRVYFFFGLGFLLWLTILVFIDLVNAFLTTYSTYKKVGGLAILFFLLIAVVITFVDMIYENWKNWYKTQKKVCLLLDDYV